MFQLCLETYVAFVVGSSLLSVVQWRKKQNAGPELLLIEEEWNEQDNKMEVRTYV